MKLRYKLCSVLLLVLVLMLAPSCGQQANADEGNVLYVVTAGGELNIRSKPWGRKIGWLDTGDAVTYVAQVEGWTKILCKIEEGEGWVKSEYLTACPGDEGKYQNQSGGRVRVRSTPGGKAVRWLKNGNTVEVTSWMFAEDGSLWAYIGDGYVAGEFLTKADD